MRRQGYRYQRTIAQPVEISGTGFLSGVSVRLQFRPADAQTGILFVRTDLKGSPAIAARVANVTGTKRRTTLGQPPAQVELVEHVLAALAGMRIDNCIIELDAPEPPGLDGSARGFVRALVKAGITVQSARREVWATERPVTVMQDSATVTLHPEPTDRLHVSYLLDYGLQSSIGPQRYTQEVAPESFQTGVAASRTFLLQHEAEELRRQGLGSRTTTADLLVFGPRGPIGNRLRSADEPARHKVLDIVGDLALFGHDLRGHVVAYRSGHALNVELVRRLTQGAELDHAKGQRLAA